jgi:hypothetical protein
VPVVKKLLRKLVAVITVTVGLTVGLVLLAAPALADPNKWVW